MISSAAPPLKAKCLASCCGLPETNELLISSVQTNDGPARETQFPYSVNYFRVQSRRINICISCVLRSNLQSLHRVPCPGCSHDMITSQSISQPAPRLMQDLSLTNMLFAHFCVNVRLEDLIWINRQGKYFQTEAN